MEGLFDWLMVKTLQEEAMQDNKNKIAGWFSKQVSFFSSYLTGKKQDIKADIPLSSSPLFWVSYDGEKNLGEIGPIKKYVLDYDALRLRSWQSYLESEITQTVLNKYGIWVVGSGLKLQCDPVKKVLETEGIELDSEEFNEKCESRFRVYAYSRTSDYSNMGNLHIGAKTALLNAMIGGDVLVVLRVINGVVKFQLIDGAHLSTPFLNSLVDSEAKNRGNVIRNGIELSSKGEHVAYYVKSGKDLFTYERIPARSKESGQLMAYLVYGLRYRLDNHRGMPLIATVLETIKKLERYKEATVGSAEERQKIAFSIEHKQFSTGENPLTKNLAKAYDIDKTGNGDLPVDVNGRELANTVAASTNKQAWNMPVGAELKMHESKNELYFKDFYNTNINLICAAIGIPPEVAMSKYDSNFSASRAALKDWEHTINVARKNFAFQFYQPIYDLWLSVEILKNKIPAQGYLKAFLISKNTMVLDAYHNARFVGAGVPHIDPLKEVNAERAKLGAKAINIPLTTVEAATEALNGGDSDSNIDQFAEEFEYAEKLGLKTEVVETSSGTDK